MLKGMPPVDPTTDLLSFLKPHEVHRSAALEAIKKEEGPDPGHLGTARAGTSEGNPERPTRWEDALLGAETALRNAWRVNVVSLSFRTVTAITLGAILALCLFVAAVLPAADRRTRHTDALEFALVTLLTVMFSPLSFNYAYVWLIYPTTLALHLVFREPAGTPWHRLKVAWITAVFLIPALAIPMPLLAQAYGNLFLPALLLVFGLGAMLYAAGRCSSDPGEASSAHFAHVDRIPITTSLVRNQQTRQAGIAFFRALAKNAASIQARHPARRNAADGGSRIVVAG